VVTVALGHLVANPGLVLAWRQLLTSSYRSPWPWSRWPAGLPQTGPGPVGVRDRGGRDAPGPWRPRRPPEHPRGRIRTTRKLLTTAALVLSGFLITSSFATTVLIPHQAFEEGGQASGRALADLAHQYRGGGLGPPMP
jgi:hypothetical protein